MSIEDHSEDTEEKSYWSRDIAALLQIGNSTLRKWCGILESQGYRFIKDDQERRSFTHHDIVSLTHFKELTQENGVALEKAAKVITERFNREATQLVAPSAPGPGKQSESAIERLLEHVERQEEFNRRLFEELTEQRRYIEESLDRRDQALMLHLKEISETRKLLAAAAEEEKEKARWWKFWK